MMNIQDSEIKTILVMIQFIAGLNWDRITEFNKALKNQDKDWHEENEVVLRKLLKKENEVTFEAMATLYKKMGDTYLNLRKDRLPVEVIEQWKKEDEEGKQRIAAAEKELEVTLKVLKFLQEE